MDVQFGPNSHDEPNLLYKLQRKIKVFATSEPLANRGYNLVASASKYGIVFIGTPDGKLAVYYLSQLVDKDCDAKHMSIQLSEKPTHIAVSCDQEFLAVVGGQSLVIYKVVDFQNPNVSPSLSMKCEAGPSTFVSGLQWNPCIPDTIAIVFYDGTLIVCQASTGQVKKIQSKARCLCWSPKGKQLVVGNNDGTICQFKPELTAIKLVPAPNLFEGAPVEAMAIHWISTFQFAVVYKNASDNSRPAVTIVNTPKAGQPMCVNYEDICYSMGSARPWYYQLLGVAQWNMILCASSNSMEIATLGTADGANWMQWCQSDEARPELPLTDKKQENYPLGLCMDTAAVHQLPWGESVLPHMPLLHVLSQTGLLTIFNVINLNNSAPQVCSPPQTLPLPANAMISAAPEPTPVQQPPTIPAAQPKLAPAAVPLAATTAAAPAPAPAPPQAAQFGALAGAAAGKPFAVPQPQATHAFATVAAPQPQLVEQKQPVEVKTAAPPPAVQAQPKPEPAPSKETQELNAALKAEQERANKIKANEELKNMLIREVNEFQMELYKFTTKTRQMQVQFHQHLQSMDTNVDLQRMDAEKLKKDCSIEELRSSIIQLKLDLVRACAVVAEARAHTDAKELDQWSQADPLTTKRVASVKQLAYYVKTQLAQAHRALDHKWNEMADKEERIRKPGPRMTRPILDDVYQPLVKQQEILCRQQALLKTLRETLDECQAGPAFKTTSILRSTPFKNKDPLSKLTKNILNMSIEPQTNEGRPILTAQKLDALRDMLSNHKTVKIKPVNVEMRHHLTNMRMSYEKSLKEKSNEQVVKVEPKPTPVVTAPMPALNLIKTEPKPDLVKQQPVMPSFTPITVKPAAPSVARTLFTDEPKQEPTKPQVQAPTAPKPFGLAPVAPDTRSVLKDLLQSKQANAAVKKDENIMENFMGQNICSPSNFNFSSVIVATPTSFTSKPISELNNMFTKYSPQADSKPKSNETGEPDAVTVTVKKPQDKPMTNLFQMKTTVPDVLANNKMVTIKRIEPEKIDSKENAAVKEVPLVVPKATKDVKNDDSKPLSMINTNKSIFGASSQSGLSGSTGEVQKSEVKTEVKSELTKVTPKLEAPASSASLFAAANAISIPKPQSIFGTSVSTSESAPVKFSGSIFGTASTPQTPPKTEPTSPSKSESGSIFAKSTPNSVFASASSDSVTTEAKSGSVFSSTTPTSIFGSSAKSVFASAFATTTTAASSASTPTSVFGTASTPASVFGSTTTTSSSVFGSTTTTTSVFGSATATPATTTTSVFGSATATPTTTTSSVFGSATATPATTTTSVFGSVTATPTTTTSSVFGSATATPTTTTSSVFGSATATPTTTTSSVFGSTTTTPTSVFGSTTTTPSSVFGSATATPATTTPTSMFGTTTTTPSSVFGSTTTTPSSVFGSTTTTPSSVFGSTTTTPSAVFGSTSQPVFGATTPTTQTTQPSAFTPATTQSSIFGSTTPTTQTSAFGFSSAQTSAFSPSAFGTATTQASVFGSPQTTQPSVFGTATTQSSVFGSPQTTQSSVFGSPQTTQASVFGSPSQTTSVFGGAQQSVFGGQTQASVFGTPTQTTQASVFGTPTQTTQASVFGTPTTQASVFGTPTTQASVFGSPSQNSVFGAPATTAQSGSIFGGGDLFAAVNISTTSAPSQSSGDSIFGASSPGSVFGNSNSNVFGAKQTFGQTNTTAAAIFGGAAAFGQKPAATAAAPNLWGNNSSTGGFGSSGFGQQSPSQSPSVFGTGSFSAPTQPGQAFGSPTQQQQSPGFGGGFGAKPVFGQQPGFGSPTSGGFGGAASFGGFSKSPGGGFGAAATFGGGASFGAAAFGGTSPGKVFGGGSPQPAFGSPTQSNATFESLATQNTLTFGNLAQQTAPAAPAPSFNTSPSFTGWRG